jgi:hypothetical protein
VSKDLVQELREVADKSTKRIHCELLAETVGVKCENYYKCEECAQAMLIALADRIESEYKPRPEPDSIEKVAKDMIAWMDGLVEQSEKSFIWVTKGVADPFRKRLRALGVTFDD